MSTNHLDVRGEWVCGSRRAQRFTEVEIPNSLSLVLPSQGNTGLIWRLSYFSFPFLGNITMVLPLPTAKGLLLGTENYGLKSESQ